MAEAILGEYSQELFDEMWNIMERDYEFDYDSDEVVKRISDPEFFRPFAERLLAFYNEVTRCNFSVDEAQADLLHRARRLEVSLNRNTIKSWFSGKREPKYGDEDRARLFAIAFALELDTAQTERLFHKVFLDRAFNKRSVREFVYLYCLSNNKPLYVAQALISRVADAIEISTNSDQTERTQYLADAASRNLDEDALVKFVSEHPHNFSLNNTAAKNLRQKLIDNLTVGSAGRKGLAAQEFEMRRTELADDKEMPGSYGRTLSSVDFLLYMIMGADFSRKGNEEILSVRSKLPRKEINNQFPDKQSLSMENPSSYMLRKDIILLYFYDYWTRDYLSRQNIGDYDGFVDELNDILYECGFSPLYIGNPYDWLFLYCCACAVGDYTPLDKFRSILAHD